MQIDDLIWLPEIEEKLWVKHHVEPNEVIDVMEANPFYRRVRRGDAKAKMSIMQWAEPTQDGISSFFSFTN